MIDAGVLDGALDPHQLAQRNQGLAPAVGESNREQIGDARALTSRHVEHEVDRLLFTRHVQLPDRLAAQGDPERPGNGFGLDAVERGLLLVDDEELLGVRGLDIPVHVDHAGRADEELSHRFGQTLARRRVRSVHLGDQRLQHGRPGRHLGDRHARAVRAAMAATARSDAEREGVALHRRFSLESRFT